MLCDAALSGLLLSRIERKWSMYNALIDLEKGEEFVGMEPGAPEIWAPRKGN